MHIYFWRWFSMKSMSCQHLFRSGGGDASPASPPVSAPGFVLTVPRPLAISAGNRKCADQWCTEFARYQFGEVVASAFQTFCQCQLTPQLEIKADAATCIMLHCKNVRFDYFVELCDLWLFWKRRGNTVKKRWYVFDGSTVDIHL